MALAIVLLAGAGVMIRTFLKIHNADVGVKTDNVLVASVEPPSAASSAARIAFFDRLNPRLKAIPGIESIALASTLPTWGAAQPAYELAGTGSLNDEQRFPKVPAMVIAPGYFKLMGATVLSAREVKES